MKKLYTLMALVSLCTLVHAVPADPTPFPYTLEDGTVVMAVRHGDEFHAYVTDMEGNLLEGTIPTPEESRAMRRIHRIQQSVEAAGSSNFPLKGSPKSVAILVNFQDCKFQYTRDDFYNLLNQSGYNRNGSTGSCRDYFIACSDSIFQPQFDVWGPYTVSGKVATYGAPKGNDHDTDPGAAFIEACQLAAADGVDFTQYDTDGDGVVDNVFFYYAGNNQAEGASDKTIWPHQSSLGYRNIRISGKLLASYACTSELRGSGGNTMCNIGTFCHEFGHVLGLPDFYHTESNNGGGGYTLGAWDIMAGGNYNNESRTPPTYSGYERFYLGWRKPIQLTEPGDYVLNPLTDKGDIYLIANGKHNLNGKDPNPSEFFLLESRQRVGWEQPSGSLVSTGMLVWHIDYSAQAWSSNTPNNGTPLRVHLEEAGGNRGRESATDPYPGSSNVTSWLPQLHDGTQLSMQPVYNISDKNGIISFTYISSGEQHIHAYPSDLNIETTIGTSGKPEHWEAVAVRLTGEQLEPSEEFTLTVPSKNNFLMTFDASAKTLRTSTKWQRTLTLRNAIDSEGRLDTTLYINFNPKKQNCDVESAILTIKSETNMLNITLNGLAPRHTYVVTPTLKATSDITPYSFIANWKAVEDAEQYYLTVYQAEKGESEMMQSFEEFDKAGSISAQGWSSNFVATTTGWKKDGQRSLLFKANGNQVVTEQYQAALSEISFYLNAFTADVDTIGELVVEGSADAQTWSVIDTLRLPARTKAKLFRLPLDAELNHKQVRITFWDLGGNGVAMDQFTAVMSEKITYIYRGRELTIDAHSETPTSCIVGGLRPNSTYFYQIQCTDLDKGCEEHLTPAGKKVEVKTLDGIDITKDKEHLALLYSNSTHTVCVPDPANNARLYVSDAFGQIICTIAEQDGVYTYALPTSGFTRGQVYIVKHVTNGKMRHKQRYVKFLY